MAHETATDLVERLRAGEDAAWREYMRSHGRLIFAAARRVGLRHTDLEEAFQVACVEACKSIGSLRDPARLSSWTYSIAFRCAAQIRRRKGPLVSTEDIVEGDFLELVANTEPSPADVAVRLDQAERLRAALETLAAACRKLLEALYLQVPQPSYQQISAQLELPIGSIGPTRARCLEKLKKALGPVSGPVPTATKRKSATQGRRGKT